MIRKRVLFVNHKDKQCGVHQYGVSICDAFRSSRRYEAVYAECASHADLDLAIGQAGPSILVFNYYFDIMSWTHGIAKSYGLPSFGILHEGIHSYPDGVKRDPFDFWICPDPTFADTDFIFRLVRLIPQFDARSVPPPEAFTVGSFGFGFPNKGFETLVNLVQEQYESAHIRLHMPFNGVVDKDGQKYGVATADLCRQAIYKPGMKLTITHEFKTRIEVLEFLAGNTINAFLYPYSSAGTRGISSVIDLALAVDRPFAVSRSEMFRHLFHLQPSVCVEDNGSFQQIIDSYAVDSHARLKQEWSEASFVRNLEQILDRAAGAPAQLHRGGVATTESGAAVLQSMDQVVQSRAELSSRGLGADIGDRLKSWDVLRTANLAIGNLSKSDPVLDLGAFGSEILLALHNAGFSNLTGADLNPGLGSMPHADTIRYEVTDFLETPFEDHSFSLITAISVIEHGYQPQRLFGEVSRLLKPGGYFVASFDYWPEKIITEGIVMFGMDWRIFSRQDVHDLIEIAGTYGLAPFGDIDLDAGEPMISCFDRNYTFAWIALRKSG